MSLFFSILLFFLLPFAPSLEGSIPDKSFVIGTSSGYAPYVSLNEKGAYEGFDIDFANRLSTKLGRTLIIKDLGSMPALFLALKQDKIDAIIWGVSITPERQRQVEFIRYQGESLTEFPILFWNKQPAALNSLNDLARYAKGSALAVEAGSYQEAVLQNTPSISLKQVDKVMDAILALRYGKVIATSIDPGLISRYCTQFPELQVVWVPLPPESQSFGNGIAVDKRKQELIAAIRKAVAELTEEGEIAKLELKWGLREENGR